MYDWFGRFNLQYNATGLSLDVSAARNKVWIGDVEMLDTLSSPWISDAALDVPVDHCKRCSLDVLRTLQTSPCSLPMHLEMHVDGSGKDGGSWAVTICWKSADRWFFGGYLVGAVELDSASSCFLGAKVVDSNTAELSAFAWALATALQHSAAASVTIGFDSMFASKVAGAKWSDGAYTQLGNISLLHKYTKQCNSIVSAREFVSAISPCMCVCLDHPNPTTQ